MDRNIGIAPTPQTPTSPGKELAIKYALSAYPNNFIRGLFSAPVDGFPKQIQFQPENQGKGIATTRFMWELPRGFRTYQTEDTWLLDLNFTGINLSLFKGGMIDGFSLVNGEIYLVWALADQNGVFVGMGLTTKPHQTSTSFTNGAKGSSSTFDVPKPLVFTIGARVLIRNGAIEWNWGTITAVSTVFITILMDNHSAYGTAITADSEILQWDSFRPYLSTASPNQQLAYPYYSLVGEIYTDGPSLFNTGNILQAFRVDNPFRPFPNTFVVSITGIKPLTSVALGQYIPLWATEINCFLQITASAGNYIAIYGPLGELTYSIADGITSPVDQISHWCLFPNAIIQYIVSDSAGANIYLNGYYVNSGMRG